jgi:hypothetical protein
MARWLVTRWHYQLPGNGPAVVRGGDPVTSQLGGVFSEGFQTITQAWRHDRRSMFRTLVANLSVDLVTAGTDDAAVGPAWLDPQQPQLRHFADPLYQATVTTTAALISRLDAGQATHLLRGSPPAQPRKHEGTDLDAQTRDRVRDADRHRLVRLAPKRGRSGAPGSVELRVLRLNPSVVWGELLRQVLHDGLAGGWRGVVDQSTLLVSGSPQVGETDLELLLASKNGSMTSPGWEAVATARLPLAAFTPPADRVPAISSLAEVAFSDQRGLYRRLGSAVAQLLAKNGEDRADLSREPAKSAAESVRGHWLVAAEDLLRAAIAGDAQVDEDWVQRLQYTALDAFDTFAAPYATSARYAGPYARACALLQPFPAKRNPA